jgi:hypothetical protein
MIQVNKIRKHNAEETLDLIRQLQEAQEELNQYKGRVAKLSKDGFISNNAEKALNYPTLYLDDLYKTTK